jgi:peptide-methionine (S)-S-oxide reductase
MNRSHSGVSFAGALIMAITSIGAACALPAQGAGKSELPKPAQDLAAPKEGDNSPRTAVFASGCFWCTEAVFEELDGVISAVSGYSGGKKEQADYHTVSTGQTRHAEAVRVTYDPKKITYAKLLQVFFATHDPTTRDAQGPDHGPQYRSAIFYENDEQKNVAAAYIKQLEAAKVFDRPIVTTLEPLSGFYPAEDYHQNYVKANPFNGYVRQVAIPKVKKVREKFKDDLKKEDHQEK